MLAELPAWQLLVLAAATGLLWATSLFDWSFVAGQHAFWQFPMGIDMQQVLAAYYYYVQSPWQLPLFYVSALGAPTGTNIIFTDAVPIAALAGKLIHSLTGVIINPYGAFLLLCSVLPGVTMTFVLIATRTRYALAAVTGAIFADAMPALLWRWGDIALEAQFLLIGALALYLFSLRARCWRGLAAGWIGYLALTYLNKHLSLRDGRRGLVIRGTPARVRRTDNDARGPCDQSADGRRNSGCYRPRRAIRCRGALPFAEYGHYSMNLLSPFVPQGGGVFHGMAGIIDATGGQYEGFNYLGLGLLVASVFVLPTEVRWLRHNARRHTALLIACAALTAVAVSHRVFLGHWLILTLPMPDPLNHLFGIFRSSGRFFWLIGYAQIAVVVVLAYRRPRPGMALCLFGAALLQICDVQPLHDHIVDTIAAGRGAEELDHNEVARLVAGAGMIEVAPSFQCSASIKQISANMQLMLAAARSDVPTNTVYMARQSYGLGWWDVLRRPARSAEMFEEHRSQYCQREIEQVRNGGRPDEVFVLLSDRPRLEQIAPGVTCSRLSWARYCQAHGNDQAGQQ